MQKYRVMINGEHVLTEVDGVREKLGFFTNVFLEAFTADDAQARAIEIVREGAGLADIRLNTEDDPLILSVEEICEIESFDGHKTPRDAFVFYPQKEP